VVGPLIVCAAEMEDRILDISTHLKIMIIVLNSSRKLKVI